MYRGPRLPPNARRLGPRPFLPHPRQLIETFDMSRSDLAVRGRTFVRNVLANWAGLAAEVIVAFVLTPFIVHSLGLATYGVWSLLNSVIGYLGLVDLGIRGGLGRFINTYIARREPERVDETVSTSLAFLTAVSVVAISVAFILSMYFRDFFPRTPRELEEEIRLALPAMAIGLWLAFLGSVFRTVLAALDRFDLVNAVGLMSLALRAAATIAVLQLGWGLTGLVAATVGTSLFSALACAALARRLQPDMRITVRRVSGERFGEMWKFGIVAFSSRSASTLAVQSGPLIAMTFLGPAAVGVYGIAVQLTQSCQRVIEQLGTTMYPSLMRLAGVTDKAGLAALFTRNARYSYSIACLLYIGLLVFAPAFLALWVGPDFDPAVPVIRILAVADLVGFLTSTGTLTLFGLGKLRMSFVVSTFDAIATVALSVLFTGPFGLGLPGLALGVLVPRIVVGGIAYPLLTARAINLDYRRYLLMIGSRVLLAGALTLVVFLLVRFVGRTDTWLTFFLTVGVAAIAYMPIGILLFLEKGERESFSRMLTR